MQLPSESEGAIVPPPYLSASSISTWKQCPLRYKLSRIDKIPEGTSEALLMGSFVHEVLEHLYKQPAAERTLLNAKQISSYIWATNNWQQQVEQIVHTEQGIRQLRWNSWWCIENLWIIEDPMHVEPSGVETRLVVKSPLVLY
jgi:putative RecB family exonuclease